MMIHYKRSISALAIMAGTVAFSNDEVGDCSQLKLEQSFLENVKLQCEEESLQTGIGLLDSHLNKAISCEKGDTINPITDVYMGDSFVPSVGFYQKIGEFTYRVQVSYIMATTMLLDSEHTDKLALFKYCKPPK